MLPALLAIVLGAARLFGIAAFGRALLRRRRAPWLTIPLAILAGGAGLGVLYSILLWLGWRDAAIVADMAGMVFAVVLRGRQTALEMRRLFEPLAALVRRSRSTLAIALAIGIVYLFNAVMPVRETDALRYHLAHVAQIDHEGVWSSIAAVHYAFPFAWQATFLPVVHFGLPEATQVADLGLWLVALAAVIAQRGVQRIGGAGLLVLVVVALSPLAIGTATTPNADAFTLLSALVVALLFVGRTPDASGVGFGEATALGFGAWVGIGTRYQAAAIGIAATIVALIWLAHSDRWVTLLGFVEGAVLAWVLAAPFFLANAVWFGNPAWPLRAVASRADYVATVGAYYSNSWHGPLTLGFVAESVVALLTTPAAAPVPLVLLAGCVAAAFARGPEGRSSRRVALFSALFMLVWVFAQPMLYPRFVVYLIGPALVLALRHVAILERGGVRYLSMTLLAAAGCALGAYACAGVALDTRALVAGGREALRASTWYYPAYEWLNDSTASDARILAITRSQETFYLDRYYRRADPSSSAEIDWPAIHDGIALAGTLGQRRFDYVLLDTTPLGGAPGATELRAAIDDAVRHGALVEVRRFPLWLTRSRFRDTGYASTAIIYRVIAQPVTQGASP
jgi:hypothetical protein